MIFRIVVFLFLTFPAWIGVSAYDTTVQPDLQKNYAIEAVNGGDLEAQNLRIQSRTEMWPEAAATIWTLLIGCACFAVPIKRAAKNLSK